jgi:hypothetical protein
MMDARVKLAHDDKKMPLKRTTYLLAMSACRQNENARQTGGRS